MSEEVLPPVEVPFGALTTELLDAVIDEFILREGTDYGEAEVSADKKREQIRRQIKGQHVVIAFDPNTESVTLLTRLEFKARLGTAPSPV